jgi:hypothetical protein
VILELKDLNAAENISNSNEHEGEEEEQSQTAIHTKHTKHGILSSLFCFVLLSSHQ